MRLTLGLLAAAVVLISALALWPALSGEGPRAKGETWSDGVCTYDVSPPLAGYIVPKSVFADNYAMPAERMIAISRPMTAEELAAYARGGKPPVTRDYPLFVFRNQGVNVFLWKGRH